ncbi:MAG: ABC transporter ATP-binding protein [Actinobacteria bacterium]|nr:ABC transporter ATP-binding protein [Actinomycetota bacterium]
MTLVDTDPRATPAAPGRGAAPAAVRTAGLTKAYGGRTVVDALDLEVPAGVVSGFVGPNGAGKTTTIRMLLGLVRPTSGTGTVLDEPLAHPARYLGSVGAMIEGPAFTPALSGRDNLLVLARAGGLPTARVPKVLDRVGLGARGDDAFRSYSLGMKQRLGIAAALLPQPRLLVLDEPTNGLDPAGIAQMRELLASFRDEGMTVLVSSHLLAEVEQVADHLVMIRQGRLVFQGSVAALVATQHPRIVLRTERPEDADVVADVAAALDWPATSTGGEVTVPLAAGTPDGEAFARAAELNRRAHGVGVVLTRLELERPTLEDAFFSLTGAGSGDVR